MGVKLPQYGGEGVDKYKGNKTDMKLGQHGGEGGGSTGTIAKGADMSLLLKDKKAEYCGPGRYLKSE